MNAKALLGLGLAIAAGAALLLTLQGSDDDSGGGPQRTTRDSSVSASGDAPLAGVDANRNERRSGRAPSAADAAVRAALVDLADASVEEPGTRAIEVTATWPEGGAAPPDGAILRAVAFDRDLDGVRLLRLLHSPSGFESPWRAAADLLLSELDPGDLEFTRASALSFAPLKADEDGLWRGVLHVPGARGRVFVHVVGAAAWSERAAIADVTVRRISVPLAHAASLTVEVVGDGAADAILRIAEPEDVLEAVGRGTDGPPEFKVEAPVDADGRLGPLVAPAGRALEVSVRHPSATGATDAPFTLEPGEVRTVRVDLGPGATLAGRVLLPDGAPAGAGFTVDAVRPGRAFGFDDQILRETRTDAEGRFELVGLEGTTFAVRADGPDLLGGRTERFELAAGGERRDLVVTLGEGSAVAGRVVDAAGAPVVGHEVHAVFDVGHMMGPASLSAMSGPTGNATTDAEGAFRITGLGKGPFSVTVLDPAEPGTTLARQDGVAVGEDGLELVARPPQAIEGVATDETGAPVAALEVQLARLATGSMGEIRIGRRRATTGADGAFRFDDVVPGRYELWSRTETHASLEGQRVVVEGGEATTVTLVAPRAASASGVVLAPDGRPVADAEVLLVAGDEAPWQPEELSGPTVPPTRTNAEGRFALLGLPATTVQLRASKRGFARGETEPFDLRAGESLARIQISLQTGGTIEGICFDEEGLTANDRLVTAQSMSLGTTLSTATSEDGTFRLEGLEPGSYQLVALDPDALRAEADAGASSVAAMMKNMRMARTEVVEGETAFVFLGAPAVESIEVKGRVTKGGEPVADLLISWAPAGAGMQEGLRTTSTDANGEYALTVETSGDFLVTAARMGSGAAKSENVEGYATIPKGASKFDHDIEIPGGIVEGRVLGPDGEPAIGVRVSLMQHGPVPVTSIAGSSYGEITSGAGGAFRFDSLGPGRYVLAAGGAPLLGESQGAPARVLEGPFTLERDGTVGGLELRLTEAGRLRVTVVDPAGSPVPEAAVFVRDAEGRFIENITLATTSTSGARTIDGLAPGRYTVSARNARLAAAESAPVEVRAGETARLEVLAEAGVILIASLRADEGVDLRSARIQLLDDEGRDVSRCLGMLDMETLYADEGFSFEERRFGPLPPGRYRVTVETADGLEATKPVRLSGTSDRERVILRPR